MFLSIKLSILLPIGSALGLVAIPLCNNNKGSALGLAATPLWNNNKEYRGALAQTTGPCTISGGAALCTHRLSQGSGPGVWG